MYLRLGHHGSDSSNSERFLREVKPKFGLLSCKHGNTYGHPNKSVMEAFERIGAKIYRTDESRMYCDDN